jgi:hypothetical protein
MSYEMTLKVQPASRYSSLSVATPESVGKRLVTGLGQAATLIRLAEQLDEVAVAYNASSEANHVAAHQSVLDTVGNVVGGSPFRSWKPRSCR